MATYEATDYAGWKQAHRIANAALELVVVSSIGPRIMSLALRNSHNLFRKLPEDQGQTGGDEFRLYGGQRLWAAPENRETTYYPDNHPCEFRQLDDSRFLVTAARERGTHLQKEMEIQIPDDTASVTVVHRITNQGTESACLAPWALSVMNLHGTAIVPLPPYGSHAENLAPVSVLSLWAYTDLTDPRWTLGDKYILLRQDALAGTPQKLGLQISQGWAAYVLDGVLFVKTFGFEADARYPDYGCNTEIYTDHRILEVESLGPLAEVAPGAAVTQTETWHLFSPVQTPSSDDEVEAFVMPHVRGILDSP